MIKPTKQQVVRLMTRVAECNQRSLSQQWSVRLGQAPLRRVGSFAYGATLTNSQTRRHIAARVAGSPVDLVLGYGFQHITTKIDSGVRKVIYNARVDEVEPARITRYLQNESDIVGGIMGRYWLGATYAEEDLRFLGRASVAFQPQLDAGAFCPLDKLLVAGVSPTVVKDFASAALTVFDSTGLIPDIYGQGNIAVVDHEGERVPVVVDNIPLRAADFNNQHVTPVGKIVAHLDGMSKGQ